MLIEAEQDPALAPPLQYAQQGHAYLKKLLHPIALTTEEALC